MVLNINSEELIKKKIADKDKAKLKYKQRLNSIKQHYGIEFDVEHLKNNEVENIRFVNLKYKNGFENVCVNYNPNSKKISYIDYEFTDTRIVKNTKHKKLAATLEKDYKLNLIVGEIERANNDYVMELEEIDNYYVELEKSNSEKIKELDITKKDKNE